MKKSILLTMLILQNALPAALEIPLRYRRHPDRPETRPESDNWHIYNYLNWENMWPVKLQKVSLRENLPKGEWKLPRSRMMAPLFGVAMLGDRNHLLVLDQIEGGVYVLYFDAKGNGDLRNSAPILGGEEKKDDYGYESVRFPPVDMMVRLAGIEVPYSFKTKSVVNLNSAAAVPDIYLESNCSWWGEFQLKDLGRFKLALYDAQGNGRFDDGCRARVADAECRQTKWFSSDFLYLTDGKRIDSFDLLHVGKILVIRGQTFALDIDIDFLGWKISLEPNSEDLPKVRLSMKVDRMSLTGGAALFQCEGKVGLPVGRYGLLGYQVLKIDKAGGTWQLKARAESSKTSQVEVGKDGAALIFGEPFVPGLRGLRSSFKRGLDCPEFAYGDGFLSLEIKGAGGESVSGLSLLTLGKSSVELSKNHPNLPKEPAYRLTRSDGTILDEGDFNYVGGYFYRYVDWTGISRKQGNRLEVHYQVGPFATTVNSLTEFHLR